MARPGLRSFQQTDLNSSQKGLSQEHITEEENEKTLSKFSGLGQLTSQENFILGNDSLDKKQSGTLKDKKVIQ